MEMNTCCFRSFFVIWVDTELVYYSNLDNIILADDKERPGQFAVVSKNISHLPVCLSVRVVGEFLLCSESEAAGHLLQARHGAVSVTGVTSSRTDSQNGG